MQSLLGAGAEVNIARSDVSDVTCVHRVHVHVYCGEDGGEAQHGVWCAFMYMCVVCMEMKLRCHFHTYNGAGQVYGIEIKCSYMLPPATRKHVM